MTHGIHYDVGRCHQEGTQQRVVRGVRSTTHGGCWEGKRRRFGAVKEEREYRMKRETFA